MKYQVIRLPRHHRLFFDILYHSQSRLNFSNGLYTVKIGKWVYTFKVNIKVKKTSRHTRSLISSLESSDSGSFTFGLAGGHLYIFSVLFFVDNLRWNNMFFVWKNNCLGHLLTSDVLNKMSISLPVQNGAILKLLFFALNGLFGDGTISCLL